MVLKISKLKDILICSDLDGTLLREDKTISDENIEAIRYFQKSGGIFTFVTGRMPFFVTDIYNRVLPNAPIGCINGGGVYDFSEKKYIWTAKMAEGLDELVKCIDKGFPEVGYQVNTYNQIYFCRENEAMKNFRAVTGVENIVRPYDEIEETIAKIVFGSEDEEEILAIEKALREHPLADKFEFVRSERTLFEILPKGIDKGVAIKKLAEVLGIDDNKTVAVGDYDNDIGMLKAAKVGIAVGNAADSAKAAADFIICSNEENAIARLIYDLADGKYL